MAQFYTLDQAARVLGMDPEELKTQAQQRKVRAFLDGGTWRFRVGDIDEEARRRGMGSDAELRLSDLEIPVAPPEGADDIDISEFQIGIANPDLGAPTMEVPQTGDSVADQDILLDDMSLPPSAMTSSSVIIGMGSTSGRLPSDSDVRLIPDNVAGSGSGPRPSDSDVRLTLHEFQTSSDSGVGVTSKSKAPGDSDVTLRHPSDSDVTLIAGDTSENDALVVPGMGMGDTAVRQSPLSGSSEDLLPAVEADSDFDLTPSSINEAVPESGSDFELSAIEESDEFDSTPLAGPGDSDVTAADPNFSGINLSRPSDSGINLQMASGLGLGGDSIELTPLSGSSIKPNPPVPAKPKPSLARTPPPTRKPEKDIFDDTDFEVDALDSDRDSDDRTMQLEAQSDFELEESDTGSEVFAIDEDDVDQNAATALGPRVAGSSGVRRDSDDDGFPSGGEEGSSGWDVESESTPSSASTSRASAPTPVLAGAGSSAEWGGLWVGMLGVATLFMLFLMFVSLDLVRNLYDFRGDSPASGIVKGLAGLLGG